MCIRDRLYGDMDETGVEWQQQLGNWWQSDKPWLRQALPLESEKQRDWFFWRQKGVYKRQAYTSVSHMGFVLIAIYTGSQLAYQGAVIQTVSYTHLYPAADLLPG